MEQVNEIDDKIIREWIEKAKPLVDSAYNLGVSKCIDIVQGMRDRCKEGSPKENIENVMLLDAVATILNTIKKPETKSH